MFGVPLLVPGLILLLAGSHWFTGAVTVGWILTIVGVLPLIIAVLLLAVGLAVAAIGALVDR